MEHLGLLLGVAKLREYAEVAVTISSSLPKFGVEVRQMQTRTSLEFFSFSGFPRHKEAVPSLALLRARDVSDNLAAVFSGNQLHRVILAVHLHPLSQEYWGMRRT
jgi:hypothetical protein